MFPSQITEIMSFVFYLSFDGKKKYVYFHLQLTWGQIVTSINWFRYKYRLIYYINIQSNRMWRISSQQYYLYSRQIAHNSFSNEWKGNDAQSIQIKECYRSITLLQYQKINEAIYRMVNHIYVVSYSFLFFGIYTLKYSKRLILKMKLFSLDIATTFQIFV